MVGRWGELKDGGRGRGPQKQSSINSLLSLQLHCGNSDCGPQIKWNGFNLWRHPGLQLMVLVFFTCFCQTQSFSPLWVRFVFGSSRTMSAFSEKKKIVFSAHPELSAVQSGEYSQSCLDSNVFVSHKGVAHTAAPLPLHHSCFLPPHPHPTPLVWLHYRGEVRACHHLPEDTSRLAVMEAAYICMMIRIQQRFDRQRGLTCQGILRE